MFVTKNKKTAVRKLKELFSKKIIFNVYTVWDEYIIETISAKDMYKNMVEDQSSMPKYLDHLLTKLELDEQEAKSIEVIKDK